VLPFLLFFSNHHKRSFDSLKSVFLCSGRFRFVLNNESGSATIASKYEKDRMGNKEDVALL